MNKKSLVILVGLFVLFSLTIVSAIPYCEGWPKYTANTDYSCKCTQTSGCNCGGDELVPFGYQSIECGYIGSVSNKLTHDGCYQQSKTVVCASGTEALGLNPGDTGYGEGPETTAVAINTLGDGSDDIVIDPRKDSGVACSFSVEVFEISSAGTRIDKISGDGTCKVGESTYSKINSACSRKNEYCHSDDPTIVIGKTHTVSGEILDASLTNWFNRDGPSGSGDYETLTHLRQENPGKICSEPLAIECQTTGGKTINETGQNVACNTDVGLACVNSKNSEDCEDYQVRFLCEGQEYAGDLDLGNGDVPLTTGNVPVTSDGSDLIIPTYQSFCIGGDCKLYEGQSVQVNLNKQNSFSITGNVVDNLVETPVSDWKYTPAGYCPPDEAGSATIGSDGTALCAKGTPAVASLDDVPTTIAEPAPAPQPDPCSKCGSNLQAVKSGDNYCCPSGSAASSITKKGGVAYCGDNSVAVIYPGCSKPETTEAIITTDISPTPIPGIYTVSIDYISSNQVRLNINGQRTDGLAEGQSTTVGDVVVTINENLYSSKETGISAVQFSLTKKAEFNFDSGCEQSGRNYAYGYRTSRKYCDITNNFLDQKDEGETCTQNYECEGNLCISGECISQGTFDKFLNWFNTIFGR